MLKTLDSPQIMVGCYTNIYNALTWYFLFLYAVSPGVLTLKENVAPTHCKAFAFIFLRSPGPFLTVCGAIRGNILFLKVNEYFNISTFELPNFSFRFSTFSTFIELNVEKFENTTSFSTSFSIESEFPFFSTQEIAGGLLSMLKNRYNTNE